MAEKFTVCKSNKLSVRPKALLFILVAPENLHSTNSFCLSGFRQKTHLCGFFFGFFG